MQGALFARGDYSIRINGLGFTPPGNRRLRPRCQGLLSPIEIELDRGHRSLPLRRVQVPLSDDHAARRAFDARRSWACFDQAAELGCRRCIFVDGETASHPQLQSATYYRNTPGGAMQVELFTNGTRITPGTGGPSSAAMRSSWPSGSTQWTAPMHRTRR